MALTVLAIPFIFLGVLIKPYSPDAARCFTVSFLSREPFCYDAGSMTPDAIKYGCFLIGIALIYAGRRQIKRARGQ